MTPERQPIPLTPEGDRRRDEILRGVTAQLPGIVARRRRRRRAARGAVAMILLFAAGGVLMRVMRTPIPAPTVPPPLIVEAPAEAPPGLIDFAIVRTSETIDPSIYIRTDTEAINAMVISDDELLRALASMGRPAGLIRMNGEIRLTRNVVDAPAKTDPNPL